MPYLVELRSAGQPGRTGTDNGHSFSGTRSLGLRHYPSRLKPPVDDRQFDILDCNRRVVDAEDARTFTWRRTDAAGKFRKVVSLMQSVESLTPVPSINQIIPFGNQIVDGTP